MAVFAQAFLRPLLISLAVVTCALSCGVRPDREPPGVMALTPAGGSNSTPADGPTGGTAVSDPTPGPGAEASPATAPAPAIPPTPVVADPSGTPPTPVNPPSPPIPTPPIVTTPVIDWAYVNAKVFAPNCASCHKVPRNTAGVNVETYASVKASLDRIRNVVIIEGSMPPRQPLKADVIAILKAWIDAGAPETVER